MSVGDNCFGAALALSRNPGLQPFLASFSGVGPALLKHVEPFLLLDAGPINNSRNE